MDIMSIVKRVYSVSRSEHDFMYLINDAIIQKHRHYPIIASTYYIEELWLQRLFLVELQK